MYVCMYLHMYHDNGKRKKKEAISLRVCDVPERLDKGVLERAEISFYFN